MRKLTSFNRKGKLNASAAPVSKKRFTALTLGLEDVYFTWGTVSDAARYAKMVDKLKEYFAVHFRDQATLAARAMGELKSPAFVNLVCPTRMHWADKGQTRETKSKHNTCATKDNEPKMEY